MRSVLLFLCLALPGLVTAQSKDFDYTFVQASYSRADFDSINADGDGLGLSASLALSDNFHVFGGYAGQDIGSNFDADGWKAGVGLSVPLSGLMDVVVQLSYQSTEVNSPVAGRVDNDGMGVRAGVRVGTNEWIEVYGGLSYVDLDSGNETGLDAGFLLNLSDAFAVGVSGSWDDDVTVLSIDGRLYFD